MSYDILLRDIVKFSQRGSAKRAIGNKIMGGRMAENFERAREVLDAAAATKDMEKLKV